LASTGTASREGAAGGPGSTAGAAVEVASLRKRYGTVEAVKDVSFRIERGEVFAFLGPNGAGKTTTVRMLCTLTRPSGGHASVAGFDVARQPEAERRPPQPVEAASRAVWCAARY